MKVKQWPVIRELIGRAQHVVISIRTRWAYRPSKDLTRPDSAFWDKARRGLATGLEISGLLLKPLASKTAQWVMGKPLQFKQSNPRNQEALNEWWAEHHSDILFGYEEGVALGNYYLVVNADLSITAVPDDVVDPIVDENDYSKIIGYKITQRFQHPTEIGRYMVEINEYTDTERVRRVQFETGQEQTERFPNLIGICPVIHIANNRASNDVYGQPEGAALVTNNKSLLHQYGEILDAGLQGNIKQGRPTPVFELKDKAAVDHFLGHYGQTETDSETGEQNTYIDFDADNGVAIAGKFYYASPGAFAVETEKFLGILYWILLEHTEIPEFVMGTAIASSKASTETQMPVFIRWIEKKRGQVSGWVLQLAEVVNALQALTMPGVTREKPTIMWDELTSEDGALTQKYVEWAYSEGLIDKKTALMLAPKKIEDIDAVLAKAKEERNNPDEAQDREFTRALRSADAGDDDDDQADVDLAA
ncbi:MAG: phage portal protein [Anaerolineae bacterium]|nr:phage portal protein [Anaerolineae bacterium]